MFNTPAYLLLTLYTAIIVVSYTIVRHGWLRSYPVFVVAGTANALVMFLFSLARGNMVMQAVVVGPSVGFLFVALGVFLARYFREAAPAKAVLTPIIVLENVQPLTVEQPNTLAA